MSRLLADQRRSHIGSAISSSALSQHAPVEEMSTSTCSGGCLGENGTGKYRDTLVCCPPLHRVHLPVLVVVEMSYRLMRNRGCINNLYNSLDFLFVSLVYGSTSHLKRTRCLLALSMTSGYQCGVRENVVRLQ